LSASGRHAWNVRRASPLLRGRKPRMTRDRTPRWGDRPMTSLRTRDEDLFVDVVGRACPMPLMHGGPGADHCKMLPFRRLVRR
jgi:hypothetical protein